MTNFNLLDQPFIPCLMQNGPRGELSLKDTLFQAHEIAEVRDASPLVTITLHRLLLAILHRNFGPRNLAAWKPLWQAERFDTGTLTAYFDRWRSRFDLFDADHPFYQTGGLETDKPLPVAALFDDLACNNNATLFDHRFNDNPEGVTPAEAARGLIARQAFALGLGVSPVVRVQGRSIKTGNRKDGPLARGLLLLFRGDNLFQTLLLNLSGKQSEPSEDDLPVWERDDPERLMRQTTVDGRLDLYTFQCRYLRLVPPTDINNPKITHVHFAQGRAVDEDSLDPMKPYQRDKEKKEPWRCYSLSEEKALWRDSSALFDLAAETQRPVAALNWVAQAARDGLVDRQNRYNLDAFAAGTQPGKASKLILWRHDRIPVPLHYLDNKDLVNCLSQILKVAEEAGRAVRSAAWHLAKVVLFPNKEGLLGRLQQAEVEQLARSLAPERTYWPRLEPQFREFLLDIPKAKTLEEREPLVHRWFLEVVRREALDAFLTACWPFDGNDRFRRAVTLAGRGLRIALRKIANAHNLTAPQSQESTHETNT